MPLPKIIRTPEQQAAADQLYRAALAELDARGVIQRHEIATLPADARLETPCFDQRGLVSPRTFQPMSVSDWIADCAARNVVPVSPNH